MKLIKLSSEQQNIINHPVNSKIFLEGPAGSGKTTVAVNRIIRLLSEGVRGDSILIVVPQNTLATPYRVIKKPDLAGGAVIAIQTISGLARKMIE
ncbi:MAG: UvrD-helicase domain-containing protein, partial [Candidatus Eremiobacterota bacterium]